MAKVKTLPSNLKETLLNAMSVAESSIEAAEYLVTQFKQLLIRAKMLDKCGDILKKVEEFAKYTTFKLRSSAQPWYGQSVESSSFKNMQNNIAMDAVKNLGELGIEAKDVIFDFAVNDHTSEFLRGCSVDEKALTTFDKLFNAWLAEKNLISVGSTLYEITADGQIKLDGQGKQVKANPAQVKQLINDPEQGFAKYMEGKGIKITCREQGYPTVQKGVQVQQAVREAIEAIPEAAAPTKVVPESQTTMRKGG